MKKLPDYEFRIHYADTDAGGLVYHAAYLEICERARMESLREAGMDLVSHHQKTGESFVVRHMVIDFLRSAKLGDLLLVETYVKLVQKASFVFHQKIIKKSENSVLFEADVKLACLNSGGKAVRLSENVFNLLSK